MTPTFGFPIGIGQWRADNLTGSAIFTEDYLGQFLDPEFQVRFDQNSFGNAPLPLVNPRNLRRYVGSLERDTGTTQDIKTIIAQTLCL